MPDPTITPGQVDPNLTAAEICATGTRARRDLTSATRAKVLRDYDVPAADSYLYELDHLVPLALGGTNAAANVWPQPEKEALAKDALKRTMQDLVCSGRLTLDQAQREIAVDSTAAFVALGCKKPRQRIESDGVVTSRTQASELIYRPLQLKLFQFRNRVDLCENTWPASQRSLAKQELIALFAIEMRSTA